MEEERKLILKMVEEGKISADEGAKLLKALQQETNEDVSNKTTSSVSASEQADSTYDRADVSQPETTNGSLSTKVNWEEGNKRYDEWEKEKQKKSEATTSFTDFIDNAIQKIRELDLDFNFGTYENVRHIFQHKNMTQTVLDISLENGSVELTPWNESDIKIVCDAKVYKGKNQEEARQEFLKETTFETDGTQLNFYTKTKAMKVNAVVYIPKKAYERVQLYTFNGHLKGESLIADSFSGKAVNGSLTITSPNHLRFSGETVNGPIKIHGGTLDIADIKTMNGTIELDTDIRDVEAESVNGTIDSKLAISQDARASLSATTGSIFITLPSDIRTDGQLRTNVGNYNYALSDMEITEEKKDFIQKSLQFTSNHSASPRLRLDAATKTGSISLKPRHM
ncbi:DUF4097 and DUF4098 domain-containing protein YvlB [Alteribacillus persepolensis]|uniref:DUF4097 and DUF4098 domain-containing protein YvlB n=1 Tax=Alteribacillus persepolensis TaxID=568899 RepID=A0A1G8AIA4_9BACI|nr:DUF4097 domain-containing protein [Alteribacillus persepolensis]SDH20576.1 DUF4097 and DUF4098 domain-containing protein YvlB [Alteribacillus persepolensis]